MNRIISLILSLVVALFPLGIVHAEDVTKTPDKNTEWARVMRFYSMTRDENLRALLMQNFEEDPGVTISADKATFEATFEFMERRYPAYKELFQKRVREITSNRENYVNLGRFTAQIIEFEKECEAIFGPPKDRKEEVDRGMIFTTHLEFEIIDIKMRALSEETRKKLKNEMVVSNRPPIPSKYIGGGNQKGPEKKYY